MKKESPMHFDLKGIDWKDGIDRRIHGKCVEQFHSSGIRLVQGLASELHYQNVLGLNVLSIRLDADRQ